MIYLAEEVIDEGTFVDVVQGAPTTENYLDRVALITPSKSKETESPGG